MMPQVDEFGRPLKQFISPMIQTTVQPPAIPPGPSETIPDDYGQRTFALRANGQPGSLVIGSRTQEEYGNVPRYDQYGRYIGYPGQNIDLTKDSDKNMVTALWPKNIPPSVPQVQSAQSAQSASQMPQIQPIAAGPAQAAVESAPVPPLVPPQANDPQFANSRLRTVLNAIAGGLAGASGGPKAGMEVGSALRDSKYNRAMQDYTTNLGLRTQQAASESGRQKIGETAALIPSKIQTADSLANSRAGNLEVNRGKLENSQANTGSLVESRKARSAQAQAKLDQLPEPIREFLAVSKMTEEQQSEYADFYAMKHPHETTAEKTQARIDTEAKNIPKIAAVSGAKGFATASNAAAGRTAEESSQVTPEMQTSYQDLLKNDPTTATATLKMLPPGARLKLLNQAGIPATIPAKEQDRLFNSKITLVHVDNARKLATDPMIAKNLSAFGGRIEIIKGKIGTGEPDTLDYSKAMANLKPTEARKMGEFLNFLNYMVVWESTNLSGTRPAQKLIESLRETGPRASMSQDRLLGSLDAITRSIKANIKVILPKQDADKEETKVTPSGHRRIE
jgi:hypothetical protein